MKSLMGWDTAWTPTGTSAWAIAVEEGGEWRVTALENGAEDPKLLLHRLRGWLDRYSFDLLALDLPLAKTPITGYREADRAATRAWSRFGCPVHSPSPARPGSWGRELQSLLGSHGYQISTQGLQGKDVVEVYPHTVCLEILRLSYRYPYKLQRAGRFWPDLSPAERREKILDQWQLLLNTLGQNLQLPDLNLPKEGDPLKDWKRCEDRLDALLCVRAGIQILEGAYVPHGDEDAAIWGPELGRLKP